MNRRRFKSFFGKPGPGPDYQASSAIFKSYEKTLADHALTPVHPAVGDTFSLGNASFTVLGPSSDHIDSGNNNSLAIRITYGNTSPSFNWRC